MTSNSCRIIAVANEKGGVGKTVSVINLSAALQMLGHSVLVVDTDPQANTSTGLGVTAAQGQPSTYDLIRDPKAFPAETAAVATRWDGLDVVPAHADLAGADIELVNEYGRENRLKRALQSVTDRYDFIIVDTPPSLSLLTVNVFAAAREVLVPCQTHPYAYAALEELFDTIFTIKEEINPDLGICGILATLFDRRTRVSHDILAKLRADERYRQYLFETVIRNNTTIAESADAGTPVVYYRSASFGAEDYRQLAAEVLARKAL